MHRMGVFVASLLVMSVNSIAAQHAAYLGQWKMNPEKSDYRSMTVTVEDKGNGLYQVTEWGQSYSFRIDGKEYPSPMGTVSRWRQPAADTWEADITNKGQPMFTVTYKLHPDGRTLTYTSRGKKADGSVYSEEARLTRSDARKDLVGKWQLSDLKTPTPLTIEIAQSGADGIRFSITQLDLRCELTLDGKEHPCTGKVATEGFTMSARRAGAGLEVTERSKGTVVATSTLQASADGATLVQQGKNAAGEAFKSVYDRVR